MKTVLLVLLAALSSATHSYCQAVGWMMGDDGQTNPPGKDIGAICRDNAGHLFIAGVFSNTFNIGNSPVLGTRGMGDVYLVSMNIDSTINWTKQIGGTGHEGFTGALATDPAGNIYIAGSFGDSLWIDGQYLLHSGPSAPGFRSDVFLAKFSPSGTLSWLRQTKGYDIEYPTDVAADAAGNVYLSGHFEHDTDFGDGILVNNTGEVDAFLCKYDSNANLVWKKICQSNDWTHEEISHIEVTPDGHLYITGFYHDTTVSFDGVLLPPPNYGGQSFIASIAPSGSVSWISYLESPNGGAVVKALKLRDSNLYVAGNFSGVLVIDPTFVVGSGAQDVFLAALTLDSGSASWTRKYGVYGTNTMINHGLEAAPNGQLYITGEFRDSTRFDSLNITGVGGNKDIYVAICDSLGAIKFLHAATANGDQLAGAIAGDTLGNIYISGISLSGNVSFGTRSLTSPGGGTFLARFTPYVIPLSLPDVTKAGIHFFPNPVKNEVSWTTPQGLKVRSYTLYDIRGAAVMYSNDASSGKLHMAHLPPGSYVLQLNTTNGSANFRLIKQ